MARTSTIVKALRRGQTLARAGRIEQSLAVFASAAESDDPRLLVQHGLALARAGQMDAALEKTSRAASIAPGDVVPAVFNALTMLRSGALDKAAAEIERASALSAGNAIVATLAAALDILRGNVAAAAERLLSGPRTDNLEIIGWVMALVERRIFEAAGTDSGAVPPEPEDGDVKDKPPEQMPAISPGAALRRGERLLEAGRPKSAAAFLARASEGMPDDAAAHALYGAALFESGDFARAEEELARAPEKGPLAGIAAFYKAANAYRLGRYEDALRLADSVPMTGDAFHYAEWCDYLRGLALVALGRMDDAAPHLAAFFDAEADIVDRRLKKAIQILRRSGECSTRS